MEEALLLPPADRADLAAGLIESLDDSVDPDAERAWDTEIANRIGELDCGAVTAVPWAQARRRIMGSCGHGQTH